MTSTRKRVLLFIYLPPPFHGVSVAYRTLLRTRFVEHFDVTTVDLTVAKSLQDIETFQLAKLGKLVLIACRELRLLCTRRFACCIYPISANRNAFLKDALLIGIARVFGVPVILYAHGSNVAEFYEHASAWLRWLIDKTFRSAVAGIVVGDRLRYNLSQHLPPNRIFAVPYGVEPAPALSAAPKQHDRLTVIYLGNLVREKGVFVLLEAIPRVLEKHPATLFAFAGAWWKETERQEAERFVRENSLGEHVRFLGVITGDTKWQHLAEADIMAFPTFYPYEGLPNVLIEALQAGLPVVTTPRAAIPEIITDGENGFLVEEQNAQALADKLLRLANDPQLRHRMAEANRRKFAAVFTHEHYGQRMIDALEQLAL